jgi:hypothetical protein
VFLYLPAQIPEILFERILVTHKPTSIDSFSYLIEVSPLD